MKDSQPTQLRKQQKPFLIADDLVLSNLRQAEALYRESRGAREGQGADPAGEALLAKLNQTEELYQQFRARWESQIADLVDAQAQLASAQEANDQLTHVLKANQRQLEQERQKAERQQERASHLTAMLKDIHRSLFSGNIYTLILKACLTITGATRGLYITARDRNDPLRIRAAIDVDGYPQAPPSEFIQALCRKVLEDNDTFVSKEVGGEGLPGPVEAGEHFHNYLVAPVVLLKNRSGIIIAADKVNGDFEEDDVETLLRVGDQSSIAVENVQRRRELQSAYLSTVSALADAMAVKDPYARGHCETASRYARLIAARLNLSEHDQSVACYAAILHDIGKVGVSDGLLNKPGPLLPVERELVRSHVQAGHDLIGDVPALQTVATVVLHHHEWWDGTGYPDGLRGEEIPLVSRIVGTVDAYCAMMARRSYKEPYSDERARDELRRCAGSQFDPRVVEAFLAVLDLPEARDEDDDEDAECGLLPGFGHEREAQQAAQ